MAASLSVIFTAVLLIVATLLTWAILSACASVFSRRGGVATLLALPASIAVVVCLASGFYFWTNRPASLFEQAFGVAPPSDVVFVNTANFALGDSGSTYLLFNASPTTIARIVAAAGMTPGTPNFSANARPAWFNPPINASLVYWRNQSGFATPTTSRPATPRSSFSSEMRILTFDPTTGQAWYEFSGVD